MSIKDNTISLQNLLSIANALPEAGGVELPELSNPATASELLLNKKLIDQEGNIVTGAMPNNGTISSTMDGINTKSVTIPLGYTSGGTVSLTDDIDNEVDAQADLIAQIKSTVNSLPEADSGGNGSIGTFTLKVVSESEPFYALERIDYMSNGMSNFWENDSVLRYELVIQNIDINSYIIIDGGILSGAGIQQFGITDMTSNLVNCYNDVIFYGTQAGTTEIITIMPY